MKKPITDTQQLAHFKEKISAWLNGLTGGHGEEFIAGLEIVSAEEYEMRRIYYEIQLEARSVTPFTKKDSSPVKAQPLIFDAKQIDPWTVPTAEIKDFTNQQAVIEIQESLKSTSCRYCSGTGKVNCPECMGHKGIYCPTCRGEGKIKCAGCGGSKNVKCEQCGGTGQTDGGTGICYRCGGKKEYKCTMCEGKGSVVCGNCNGKTRVPCKACSETGTVTCSQCSGAGQSVTGFAVEIKHSTEFRKLDLPGQDIPKDILSKLPQDIIEWQREFISPGSEVEKRGLDAETKKSVLSLRDKITISPNMKALFDSFTCERGSFVRVSYRIPGTEGELWLAGKDLRIFSGENPLTSAYNGILGSIRGMISKGALKDAENYLKKIQHIEFIKKDIAALTQKIVSARIKFFITASMTGAGVFSLITIPILYSVLSKSFHSNIVLITALAFNIALGLASGYVQYLIGFVPSGSYLKKSVITGGITAALLAVCYGMAPLANFNPARSMDRNMMLNEYKEYFPFGLRTLASKEDIKFLEYLVTKYEKTGIDMGQQKKDLEWLKAKIDEDRRNLEEAEKIRIAMENAAKEKKVKKKIIRNTKQGSRITIKRAR